MVEYVDSAAELAANLEAVRDDLCADAATMPDSELRDIAAWAWQCRLDNRVHRGRDSDFSVNRQALDVLRRWDNESDAIALYVLLVEQHGHAPGKRFALDFKAMRSAGLTRLSIPRLRAARRTLEAVGLLAVAGKHRAGSVHRTYTLTRMHPAAGELSNIAAMPRLSGAGKEGGEGLRLHMTPEIEPTNPASPRTLPCSTQTPYAEQGFRLFDCGILDSEEFGR
jgi:hypothetical protein